MKFGSHGSSTPLTSCLIFAIVAVMLLGYSIIFFSTFGQDTNTIFEEKISVILSQNKLLEQALVAKTNEYNALKAHASGSETGLTTPIKLSSGLHIEAKRPGVIILGMHRSGTSALGGLMNKMGLKTGGPLIQAAEDNAKGFFERIDVVLQNDYLMQKQNVHYSLHTHKFDPLIALKHLLNEFDEKLFREGKRGLAFLNNPENYPWMLKDPRLCITLRMWLPLLNFIPAIVFTYRHPLDVALSMHKREFEQFKISKGLKMWYVYNRRAVEQSNDLCRVVTSHKKTMQQPRVELDRIYHELRDSCGVEVPHLLTDQEIASFIDIKLQHGQTTLKDHSCSQDIHTLTPPSSWETNNPEDLSLYREVMRVYCAMEDLSAFQSDFKWDKSIMDN